MNAMRNSAGAWDEARGGQRVPSILDPRVCDGNFTGLFAAYSLSKQSNLAGYRAAFIAGDAQLMPNLINSRKHAGMIVPAPVQRALIAALGDEAHVAAQKNSTARAGKSFSQLLPPQAGASKTLRLGCTCGPLSVRIRGHLSNVWPSWESLRDRGSSTVKTAPGMCVSR